MKISHLKDYLVRAVGLRPESASESSATWITTPAGHVWQMDADLPHLGLITQASGGLHEAEDPTDWEALGA